MHKKATSFEELKKTWCDKKALLKCYAESCKGEIIETHDDWDVIVQIVDRVSPGCSIRGVMYTSVGSNFPEVYDELLTMVMSSHGWSTIEEMKVWIDLHIISSSSTCHSECCLESTASQSSAVQRLI